MAQQLDSTKAANRQTDDNLGQSIDQVDAGWQGSWVDQRSERGSLFPEAAARWAAMPAVPACATPAAICPISTQVARKLSGGAAARRLCWVA